MKNIVLAIVIGSIILFAAPIMIYVILLIPLPVPQTALGIFGDYFGGVLGPIIGFFTLLTTAYIAYTLYIYENKRDQTTQQESAVNSFKELYQFFISAEFREVRVVAWYILKKAIANDEYCNFVLNENYVSRYINRKQRSNVYLAFKNILYQNDHPGIARPENEQEFLRQEALDRNKVDALVNFFQLLSFNNIPKDYFKICDFYYDTWRPVLYWYAKGLETTYNDLAENQKYNNPPTLSQALTRLDNVFYKPKVLSALSIEDFETHPIIKFMKLDSNSREREKL